MTRRSHGLFVGRSRQLSRHRKPSQLSIPSMIKDFKVGESVAISPKGTFKDIPNPRYRGKIGKIIEKRGSAYVVKVNLSNATYRMLIVKQRDLEKA